ncbi:hypothetical protein XVE_0999 [Xanthomonas vesicatoria ATCC 35937]|uniref:Uncharacterized protein n=1 Tax=Xanthomonas vesicatoria ATCC 35937 TaxID=925775 RepID=F0BA53_9XANT|nr:hypothetical protein XVE_0999 [Xanthomonas vesicatoria ATCC 35937]
MPAINAAPVVARDGRTQPDTLQSALAASNGVSAANFLANPIPPASTRTS